jgi:hypothetical protein
MNIQTIDSSGEADYRCKDTNTRIINSGVSPKWADLFDQPLSDMYASVAQAGAGIINAATTVETKTSVNIGKLLLNDTGHFTAKHTIIISNDGPTPVTYKFSHQTAGGFNLLSGNPLSVQEYASFIQHPLSMTAGVDLPPPLRVGGFSSESVTIKFSPPSGGNISAVPIYSGKILVSGTNFDELGIPYLGE